MTKASDRVTVSVHKLLDLFDEQAGVHESLLEHIDSSMLALREGRMEAFVESCRRQQGLAQRAEQLESTRNVICEELARRCDAPVGGVMGIGAIRDIAPGELGPRLDAAVQRLRPLVHAARERSGVLRRAVSSMARHISGMVQAVHGTTSTEGMYERRGVLSKTAQLDYSIDVRS
ncbi:MAG: flagellar protein FlgN [Phycisphaerales bacterium]|nr:flagellar protein FlgN [Phycisphaerales bacterium]